MDAPGHISGETSATYEGWRIVAVCFLVATFGWSFGFYGQSVYLAELNRLHGWPASLVSAATTFFYLFGAVLVAFVSEAVRSFGPRNCLLAGIITLAAGGIMIGQVASAWQLYVANAVLAFGWAGTSLASSLRRSVCGSTANAAWRSASRSMAQALEALSGSLCSLSRSNISDLPAPWSQRRQRCWC